MATIPATEKQLRFLKQLTGKDYSGEELTASEASGKIEKALANKGKEVADLPPQEPTILPEHQDEIDKVRQAVREPAPQDRDTRIDQAVIFKAIVEMLSSQVEGKSVLEKEFPKNWLSFKEWALIYAKSKM